MPAVVPAGYVEPALHDEQRLRLHSLLARAQAHPDRFAAHKAAGLYTMWLTLSGHLSFLETAEHHLERAFELHPHDTELNRSLGRFYNLRSVAGDYSKAKWQVQVYRALLGDADPQTLKRREFVAWSFFQMGRALDLRQQQRLLGALAVVRRLERALDVRVRSDPDDVEVKALAGNFALFFAGNLPTGKKRRVRRAIALFEYVHNHWDEMPAHAKDPYHCPNTYENFMFELAEAHLALGNVERAGVLYDELVQRADDPQKPGVGAPQAATRAQVTIAAVSQQRLSNLGRYSGDLRLMPPWPSDVGNCVVCHSWSADVPLTSLHTDTIPTIPAPVDLPRKPVR